MSAPTLNSNAGRAGDHIFNPATNENWAGARYYSEEVAQQYAAREAQAGWPDSLK